MKVFFQYIKKGTEKKRGNEEQKMESIFKLPTFNQRRNKNNCK